MEPRDEIAAGLKNRPQDCYSAEDSSSKSPSIVPSFFVSIVCFSPFPHYEDWVGNNSQSVCYILAGQRKINPICQNSSYRFLGMESDVSGFGPEATSGPISYCQGLSSCGDHRATAGITIWLGDGAIPGKGMLAGEAGRLFIIIYMRRRTEFSARSFVFES